MFAGRSERRGRPRGPMVWVDLMVPYLEARNITIEVVYTILVVLPSATVHIMLV